MIPPWEIGGNFNDSSNADAQATVLSADGSGTDGPMGFWNSNQSGFQGGCITLDQFAHSHGKIAEQMLATQTCGTKGTDQATITQNGKNYLAYSQACVRGLENSARRRMSTRCRITIRRTTRTRSLRKPPAPTSRRAPSPARRGGCCTISPTRRTTPGST